jgi:Protein of unknown function (DUF1269)
VTLVNTVLARKSAVQPLSLFELNMPNRTMAPAKIPIRLKTTCDDFVREVKGLMKPGTSAIFVLDDEGDMDVILPAIRGLGGTVLKTNVDLERAQLIQSTLAAPSAQTSKSDDK